MNKIRSAKVSISFCCDPSHGHVAVSEMLGRRISQSIDQALEENKHQNIKIPIIEFDLGDIGADNLWLEIPRRINERLSKVLLAASGRETYISQNIPGIAERWNYIDATNIIQRKNDPKVNYPSALLEGVIRTRKPSDATDTTKSSYPAESLKPGLAQTWLSTKLLHAYLRTGRSHAAFAWIKMGPDAWLTRALQEVHEGWPEVVTELRVNPIARRRLLSLVSWPTLRRLMNKARTDRRSQLREYQARQERSFSSNGSSNGERPSEPAFPNSRMPGAGTPPMPLKRRGTRGRDLQNTVRDRSPRQDAPSREVRLPIEPKRTEQADPLPVVGAGIVLLWPLIPRFLKRLGLIEKDRFVSDAARAEAVWQLDALVWEPHAGGEWRTTVAQLLCGVTVVNEPTPTPRDDMRSVRDDLLTTFAGSSPLLARLAPRDVRSMFLRRDGLLDEGKNAPLLQIERDGCDILLKDLPWPVLSISYPWMPHALAIRWM